MWWWMTSYLRRKSGKSEKEELFLGWGGSKLDYLCKKFNLFTFASTWHHQWKRKAGILDLHPRLCSDDVTRCGSRLRSP